ncbi:MAG: 5-formyltetrahydrofolate cyclo-ligase [Verrucomicrobia bacterium]|nr:5-formyltetrahydrofolate cyclo-ligase [Verrucomicrobiota bacterium]
MSSLEQKAVLRQRLRAELKSFSPAERAAASAKAVNLFQQQPVWHSARAVLLYAPLAEELDVWPLASQALSMGKQLVLLRHQSDGTHYTPRVVTDLERDLARGPHGIREPREECRLVATNQLDLLLVPGLAFDVRGGRLGRGRGVFDRLLAAASGARVGVAFDFQLVDAVPTEAHDAKVDCVLTPTRWLVAARD